MKPKIASLLPLFSFNLLSLLLMACSGGSGTTLISPIVSASGANLNLSPSADQTVGFDATASYTVTANSGYTLSNTVGGTCPAGSWSGSVYQTGAILTNCTVLFSAVANAPTYNYFLYMSNSTSQVDLYKIDPGTGTFSGTSTPLSVCTPFFTNPAQTFAFAPCSTAGTIAAYSIDPSTGVMAQTRSLTTANAALNSFAIDPNGHFFLALDTSGNGTLHSMSIDPATGIVASTGSPVAASGPTPSNCNLPVNVTVDSTGAYAYVSCYYSGTITIFSLNPTSGVPTYVGIQSTNVAWVGASPINSYLYAVD